MFNNSGNRIRCFVQRYYNSVLAGCVLLGIAGVIVFFANIDYGEMWIGVAMLIGAVVTAVNTYLICLFMYAFGEMVDNTNKIYQEAESIESDTTYIRKRQCDNYMPEPEAGAEHTKTCPNCGRRYDTTKTKNCPLCEN